MTTSDKPRASKPAAKPDDGAKPVASPQEIEIFPLRSYHDAGQIRRRGGPSYKVARRHGEALIASGLATAEKPETKTKPASDK
ncbi:hypothetical protein DN824_20540 [Stutzerimonas nosocomialis]|uniref:hypothetical protein n=1 Tax=Stutzerimonas nosocomialis TaxID=1056496 RepID=UPI00110948CB|nr:hypothetical protein [Stutzerimonas nosocomialis]TLX54873.1 hypothetical protein DN824_20540 [Stutzerimonas nosocomialis]